MSTNALQQQGRIPPPSSSRLGVITLLDILGWRGISLRDGNPLPRFNRIINVIRERTRGLDTSSQDRVIGLSDTVAVFTPLDANRLRADRQAEIHRVIDGHGAACGIAVRLSIEQQIPLRGATCVGDYEIDQEGHTFVGRGVDEVASWYEQGDWIGVHLTPSALFSVELARLRHWKPYVAPLKTKINGVTGCVDWTELWFEAKTRDEGMRLLHDAFIKLGPIFPEFAGKFINTLAFIEKMKHQGAAPAASAGVGGPPPDGQVFADNSDALTTAGQESPSGMATASNAGPTIK